MDKEWFAGSASSISENGRVAPGSGGPSIWCRHGWQLERMIPFSFRGLNITVGVNAT